jgi:hypothetical protein
MGGIVIVRAGYVTATHRVPGISTSIFRAYRHIEFGIGISPCVSSGWDRGQSEAPDSSTRQMKNSMFCLTMCLFHSTASPLTVSAPASDATMPDLPIRCAASLVALVRSSSIPISPVSIVSSTLRLPRQPKPLPGGGFSCSWSARIRCDPAVTALRRLGHGETHHSAGQPICRVTSRQHRIGRHRLPPDMTAT